jgi:hypothetical protein
MTETETEPYLPWAIELREAYERREAAMFVLHNNIGDVFPRGGEYVSCREYLEQILGVAFPKSDLPGDSRTVRYLRKRLL